MRQVVLSICKVFLFAVVASTFITISIAIALDKKAQIASSSQESVDLAAGILDAGELKHTVYNNGLLGTWGWSEYNVPDLPAGWYKGYGYVVDVSMWIGIPEGPWTSKYWDEQLQDSVSMGPTVSEAQLHGGTTQSDWDPTPGSLGHYHSGDVTIGDVVPGAPHADVPLMATSTIPETWPMDEYDQGYWPGPWAVDPMTGQEMEGVFTAEKEVFFSFADDPFANRDDLPNQGYPIEAQVDAWVLSYDRSYAEDFLFFDCNIINNSDWHYVGVYVAFYFDADVESYDLEEIISDRMDWMDFITKEWEEEKQDTVDYNMAFIYDYRPEPNWRPYVGVKLLETPRDTNGVELGLTDWHWFEWENRPGVVLEDRQELIQYKVISGDNSEIRSEEDAAYFHKDAEGNLDPHFDSPERIQDLYPQGTDCVFIMSSGPFEWAPHETTTFSFCLIIGDDEEDLKLNARTAQAMYDYYYQGQRVTLTSPNGGEVWSGTQEITWATESITGNPINEIVLFYSRDAGVTWDTIAVGEENDGVYGWNTVEVPDGVLYLLKILGSDGQLYGEDVSDSLFTIDNPGDAAPEVIVSSPNGGEYVSGLYEIKWQAKDADGDTITISIEYSANDGGFWEQVVSGQGNSGSYLWDTRSFANSSFGLIRVSAEDPTSLMGDDQSDAAFTLYNERRATIPVEPLPGTLGNGLISAVVIDSMFLTGHNYIISFDDSTIPGVILYDVFDEDRGVYVLQHRDEIATEYGPEIEGPLFDGLRLRIRNWDYIDFWPDSSCIWLGPLTDTTNMDFNMARYIARPADYKIIFTDEGDISSNNVVTPFEIRNTTEDVQPPFEIQEDVTTGDKIWQDGEPIRLWENNLPTWTISIFSRPDTLGIEELDTIPGPDFHIVLGPTGELDTVWHYIFGDTLPLHTGDQIILKTKKPFTPSDTFAFRTPPGTWEGLRGDVNGDGTINILDVVATINHILGVQLLLGDALVRADCNVDGEVNVLDALGIVNVILGIGECGPAACKVEMTPEVMEFLEMLKPYFSAEDFARIMALVKAEMHEPDEYSLAQNYPNPFNPITTIRYQIPDVGSPVHTTLKIYNLLGQEVRTLMDKVIEAGYYTVTWDGRDNKGCEVASGLYFYRLASGDFKYTKRMILLK